MGGHALPEDGRGVVELLRDEAFDLAEGERRHDAQHPVDDEGRDVVDVGVQQRDYRRPGTRRASCRV